MNGRQPLPAGSLAITIAVWTVALPLAAWALYLYFGG